jgi:hypothetical protein
MCPACIASAATLAAGVASGGGILAMALARLRKLKSSLRLNAKEKLKEEQS